MNTIDYYQGRAEAAKEVRKLLQVVHSYDPSTIEQLEILSNHLLGMIDRAEHNIDMELAFMEGDELLRR